MRSLPIVFLATALVSPNVFAARPITVNATALPPATMEELSRVQVAPMLGEHREHPQWGTRSAAAMEKGVAATVVVAPQATITAPAVTRGFLATTWRPTLPAGTNYALIDPADASGAAGPQHVVGAFNNVITVHDRAGKSLAVLAQLQFWNEDQFTGKWLYDPRVAYDAGNDRWILVMLGDDPGYKNGVLYIAFSTSGNPAGQWQRYRLPADVTGILDIDISHVAITADKIVIMANIWTVDTKVNSNVFTIPRNADITPPATLPVTITRLPPAADLLPLSSDDATVRLVEFVDNRKIRTFELRSDGTTVNSTVWSATGPFADYGSCSQLGGAPVYQCGGILLSGVARNGTMWIASERTSEAALVWKIKNGAATAYALSDSTYGIGFPSIAVNKRGGALVGFVLMSSSSYLSAGYAYIDPAGNISAPAVLKSGDSDYSGERWGDFTSTVVDPADDLSFWTVGVYAAGDWATWWGYIKIADNAPARRHAVH